MILHFNALALPKCQPLAAILKSDLFKQSSAYSPANQLDTETTKHPSITLKFKFVFFSIFVSYAIACQHSAVGMLYDEAI